MIRDPGITDRDSRYPISHVRPVTLPSFKCPRCGAVSYHARDVAEGYCGRCHDWTGERAK